MQQYIAYKQRELDVNALTDVRHLQVFGNDYDTVDGTGVRDYILVVDLAHSHVAAVDNIRKLKPFEALNIGTGSGLSVMQMVHEYKTQSGSQVMYEFASRRPGDTAKVWADVSKTKEKIGFQARLGATEMCRDTWRWQSANPNGYQEV